MKKLTNVVVHTGFLGRLCCWAHQEEMQKAWWRMCEGFIPKFNERIDGWNKLYTAHYGDDTSTIWKRRKYDKFISRRANELVYDYFFDYAVCQFSSGFCLWMRPRYTNKGLRFDLYYRGHRLPGCGDVRLRYKNV